MDDFTGLNLDRAGFKANINGFCKEQGLESRGFVPTADGKRIRVTLGKVGIKDCDVDLLLNNNGTTTVHYKLKKNQELGKSFAEYLFKTINADDFKSVSYSINGVTEKNINPILDEFEQEASAYEYTVVSENATQKQIKITSKKFQDSLSITHYKTTSLLLIQGRPLFVYRQLIYLLSELLDLAGLQNVLSRTDDNSASIVRSEIAKDYLKEHLSSCYQKLPNIIENLLVSGCCVKLASPKLPEYSLLLFPDLRALEGVLKQHLCCYHLYTEGKKHGFGEFFSVDNNIVSFQEEYIDNVTCGDSMIKSLNNGYTFLRKHRNTLFHMSDFAEASRKIDTLDKAISLSKDTYKLIDDIYSASKIL